MSDARPFQVGDKLTIQHAGGHCAEVVFCGIFGNNLNQVYIRWPMAGDYKVNIETGQLSPARVRMWKVVPEDLERLVATRTAERAAAHERMCSRRTGKI